jgi:hypothetical protein
MKKILISIVLISGVCGAYGIPPQTIDDIYIENTSSIDIEIAGDSWWDNNCVLLGFGQPTGNIIPANSGFSSYGGALSGGIGGYASAQPFNAWSMRFWDAQTQTHVADLTDASICAIQNKNYQWLINGISYYYYVGSDLYISLN